MKSVKLPNRKMSVAYEEAGTGLPIVLLHAFPFDRGMWAPQVTELATAGFQVLVPDLPGFGETSVGSEPFTIERGADVVAEFLAALGLPKAIIMGLSMGGYIAMALARRYPQVVQALILADTKAAADDDAARANRDKLIEKVQSGGARAAANALLPKLMNTQNQQTNPASFTLAETIALRQSPEGIIAGLEALRDRPDAAPELPNIAVPTLVIVGEHDEVTPPLTAARLTSLISGSELLHIPGAGHLSNLENPGAFNAAVIAFLQKLQ